MGNWGHKAEATLALLGDKDSFVRNRAAAALGRWKVNRDVISAVIQGLIEVPEPVTLYLARHEAAPPNPKIGELLADLLEPREDDTESVRLRRQIVFDWVWNASESSD